MRRLQCTRKRLAYNLIWWLKAFLCIIEVKMKNMKKSKNRGVVLDKIDSKTVGKDFKLLFTI